MIPLTLFLLAMAAVYVGTIETAFSALMKLSLRLMAERGRDDRLGFYLDDPIQLFVPARLLLGLIFSLATVLLAVVTGRSGLTFASLATLLACVAVYIIVCEHLIPSLIVRRNPEAVLAVLLPSFGVIARAMSPLCGGLVRLLTSGRPERLITAQEDSEAEQGEAAHAYLEAGEEQGLIERDERRLLQSIVDFGDTLAREVMTPRPDIVALPVGCSAAALLDCLQDSGHSRIPLYKDNVDHVVGVAHARDVLARLGHLEVHFSPRDLMRTPLFVPGTQKIDEALATMRAGHTHLAIVVDEFGGTAGLLTVEDILEELVGEIADEHDRRVEEPFDLLDENNALADARLRTEDLAQHWNLELPSGEFDSIGGFVIERLGRAPVGGDKIEIVLEEETVTLTVHTLRGSRAHKILIHRQPRVLPAEN